MEQSRVTAKRLEPAREPQRSPAPAARASWRSSHGLPIGNQARLDVRLGRSERQEEVDADAVAESLFPGRAPRAPSVLTSAGGDVVGASHRSQIEQATGMSVGAVRIRRDAAAHQDAARLGALAFARGRDLSFSRRAPALSSPEGLWLLAHEMTHTAQQEGGSPAVRLWPDPPGRFPDPNRVMSDVPGAIPGDLMDPLSGIPVDELVRITAPVIGSDRRARRGREASAQTHHLESAVISRVPISAYAIPRTRLTLDPGGQVAAAATGTAPAPTVAPGAAVYGPTGLAHSVLSADAANVIVESTTAVHYAVGAGSCILVRTTTGWYLFDAGINLTEPHSLAEAVVGKIQSRVGADGIRAVFLTHAHYDHTALLSRLARQLQIDAIVANPLQFEREEYVRIREGMREADLVRRAELRSQIEADVVARRAYVESLERSGSPDAIRAEDIEARWRQEVAHRVQALYPELAESTSLPVRGTGGLEFRTIGTRPLHGGELQRSVAVEDLLPSREGTELRGVVDPELHGRERMAPHEVDRMSTTYILTINGNRRLVLPDLRRTDVNRLAGELREALGGQSVEFQEWTSGHHMQIGWQEGVVSARTLRQTLELLHEFRAQGRGGRLGRDAVIASVDPAQVDAAQVRLLRLLGFEVFLAQSQTDVHTYEVVSGARVLRGVRSPLAPGARGEPTLRRSIAARQNFARDLGTATRALRTASTVSERQQLRAERRQLRERITQLDSLERTLIDAARADPYDDAAARRAETTLNEALDRAGVGRVVTSSSQLTDTAMVLLRESLGPEPEPGTPEAEQRANDVALRRQKTQVDLLRERARGAEAAHRQGAYAELYAEMVQYEHMLAAEAERAGPGVTREVVEAERARIQVDRTSLEGSFRSGEPVRLPDGRLVETQLVRIEAPEAAGGPPRGPSRAAQAMMRGLHVASRPLGALMVISTIRGSVDLIDQYEQGRANLTQLGIGGIRNATSGVVGLRMLRGARVHPGVFVVISALEVGEAYAGDYDSASERREAIDAAVRNAAIHTGCLIAGEILIATMNPVAIAAGVIIMFLGPAIIDLLFGEEPPETLFPEEVTDVDRELSLLLEQYRAVIGGLELAQRDAGEREDIGLQEDIRDRAEMSVLTHRMNALYLESRILPRFEAAYARAARGRAGLRELDVMRAQFLELRARASTDESDEETRREFERPRVLSMAPTMGFRIPVEYDPQSGEQISIRERTLRRFREMERGLDLGRLSVQEIREMDQWRSIRDAAVDLSVFVLRRQPVDPDWREIARRQHELESRLASARYRLDPAAQYAPEGTVGRRQPLLAPGTPQRAAYEEELARAARFVEAAQMLVLRSHWVNFRLEGVETPNIEGIARNAPPHASPLERRIAIADDALDVYQRTIEEIGGPPASVGGVEALYSRPAARAIYLTELESNRRYRKLMARMEVNEIAASSLLRGVGHAVEALSGTSGGEEPSASSPSGRVAALQERYRNLQSDRKVRRGILFAHEVEALGGRERQRAIGFYMARLSGGRIERRLSGEEETALSTGDYGDVGERLLAHRRTLAERLERIPNLRAPAGATEITDASGIPMRVVRELGGIMRLDGLTSDTRMLVGVTTDSTSFGMVTVVPLNDAAVEALGGEAPRAVSSVRLTPATEDDLP